MFQRRALLALLAVTAGLLFTACSSGTDVTGTWGDKETASSPFLVLEKDGSLHGSDGCNNLMGSYEVQGDTITFGQLASTLMYCEGVDDWLSDAVKGTIAADTMTLWSADERELGTLNKSSH